MLPSGLTTRPATAEDAYAIYRLIADCKLDLDGQAEVDADDVVADLSRPGLDLTRDTILVHDSAGELIGWAQVDKRARAEADVRPENRGRGIGAWLLGWTQARAREIGADRVTQTITDNNAAAADLFHGRGTTRRTPPGFLRSGWRRRRPSVTFPKGSPSAAIGPAWTTGRSIG